MIKQITGIRFDEDGVAFGSATEFLEDDRIENINHDGACFCFTGTFVSGARKAVESSVIKLGARTKKNVVQDVDYLIIGTLSSRDWRFSSHGRKIERALKLKEDGHHIIILTERTWLKYS